MDIIPPVYLVALKCCNLGLRRKAVEIFGQIPEQEGLLRCETVIRYSKWKIQYDEAERTNFLVCNDIGEHRGYFRKNKDDRGKRT